MADRSRNATDHRLAAASAVESRSGQYRRRDAAVVRGLRDERHHRPRASRRARRTEAGPSPHSLRHARHGPGLEPRLPQMREDRRRSDGQLSSARRRPDLRHARPHGAGFFLSLSRWWMARETSDRSTAIRRLPCVTPKRGWRRLAEALLEDIDKETVDFVPNYDEEREEPSYLPSKIPNLLVNGSGGIAVGMATNMPPHNLTEICEAVVHLIEHPEARLEGHDGADSRSRLSDRRIHLRPRRHPAGLPDRPRSDHDARAGRHRAAGQRIATSSSSPKFPIRSTRPA